MTIKEVAEKYDISADTLRYYERVGMIPSNEKAKWNQRLSGIRPGMGRISHLYEKCRTSNRGYDRVCKII